jgi:hypothetical protein
MIRFAYNARCTYGSISNGSGTELQSLHHLYTAQRALGNVHARYPIIFVHQDLLRIQIGPFTNSGLVYISFDPTKGRYHLKVMLDPVTLTSMYDSIEKKQGMFQTLLRLSVFIQRAEAAIEKKRQLRLLRLLKQAATAAAAETAVAAETC